MGRIMTCKDTVTGHETLRFQPGPLAAALQAGAWLLLDELNLAPDEVLQVGGCLLAACCAKCTAQCCALALGLLLVPSYLCESLTWRHHPG